MTSLIADVDCTAEGKPLCEENGVQGFPTIKWGTPGSLEDYKGGRDYDALKTFAKENLKPMCGPANIDLCDADKKAEIETLSSMSESDLEQKVKDGEKKIEEVEKKFKDDVSALQARYKQLMETKENDEKEVKES